MKIIDKSEGPMEAKDLKTGDCFYYRDALHMKIEDYSDISHDIKYPVLVLNVEDGKINRFSNDVVVTLKEIKEIIIQ